MEGVRRQQLNLTPDGGSGSLLRGSEARFRYLADAAPLLVWMTRADGRLTYVNRRWLEFTGHSMEEQLAGGLYSGVHADDRLRSVERFEEAIAEHAHFSQEMRLQRVDGDFRRLFVTGTPWFDESGAFQGYVGTGVEVITRSSGSFVAIQEHRTDAVERLAGSVAHDFSNLLTAITCSAELLLTSLPDETLREDLETIRQSAERASTLTKQLLAFSGQQVMRPQVIDANVAVQDSERSLRALLGSTIALTFELEPNVGSVKTDPSQLNEILRHLALNGRDAMPTGGVLTVRTSTIDTMGGEFGPMPPLESGAYVRVTVADTGVGMDDETRRRAFEPFFTTKPRAAGRGLGLSTVYGIAVQSGGSVWIDSGPRQGTRVHVYLPRAADEKEPSKASEIEQRPEEDSILLVEDEQVVRALTKRILTQQGYNVLSAASGAEALEIWLEHSRSIRLLITDVVMPMVGGLELVSRLRGSRPDLPVLYVSGYTREATLPLESEVAVTRFLEKPYTVDSLISQVNELLPVKAKTT